VASIALPTACACAGALPAPEAPTSADTGFMLTGASMMPWARKGATEDQFKGDARFCLDHSTDSRRAASRDERSEAAYRTFQECMTAKHWSKPADGAPVLQLRPHETSAGAEPAS